MPLTERDLGNIVQREVCLNGETTFYTVPRNRLGQISGMHVDTGALSGLTSLIRIQVRDVFLPLGGASTNLIRFQTEVLAGDVGDIPLPGPISVFGEVRINSNFSGPIVSLGSVFE